MRHQLRYFGIVTAFAMAASASLAVPVAIPTWTPDKTLVGQLAPVTTVNRYQIQPPQGFNLRVQQGPAGSNADAWVGPARADGTHSYVMLLFITPPVSELNKYTLKQACAKMLAGIERKQKNWKHSPIEQGNVNGITFVRSYWQGIDTASGLPMLGFNYIAKDGGTFLQLSSQDFTPYKDTALPLAEASALTFRKSKLSVK